MSDSEIQEIIDDYIKNKNSCKKGCSCLREWLIDFENFESLEKVIEYSGKARNSSNKKHPHQNLIPNKVLDDFANNLLGGIDTIESVKSFEKLYEIVKESKIRGIGPLAIYDTALRIGSYLSIGPDKIYLQCGSKEGAVNLLGNIGTDTIDRSELPVPFHDETLKNEEIEDILCLYKNRFKN